MFKMKQCPECEREVSSRWSTRQKNVVIYHCNLCALTWCEKIVCMHQMSFLEHLMDIAFREVWSNVTFANEEYAQSLRNSFKEEVESRCEW